MSTATSRRSPGVGDAIRALVATDGTAAAPYAIRLTRGDARMRDLSDAVHSLCVIHGAFPGLVDDATTGPADDAARDWLRDAAAHVAQERALLARLTAAIGPSPSTPNQAAAEAAVLGQRRALEMLAQSGRDGCALGTAYAFALDWAAVRRVLDGCAHRLGIDVSGGFYGFAVETDAMLGALSVSPAVERAMLFGAQQMLAQHRGLWDLLEARASARDTLAG